MKTVHRTVIVSKCPHGATDVYEAEFHVQGPLITVEAIQAAISDATQEPLYQEKLTQRLANQLSCEVVTVGSHGRFRTECRAVPEANG